MPDIQATILTIGDEILIGQIIDSNAAYLGEHLQAAGFKVRQMLTVGDERDDIVAALDRAFADTDIVLMTGGLGPTKDDVTKKVLAEYFDTALAFHEPTYERIVKMFEQYGIPLREAHREQCYLPATATLLTNRKGTAPGMWLERDGKVAVSMPGVPYEMKYLSEHEVLPRLRKRYTGTPMAHRTVLTAGMGESSIAELVKDFESGLPANMKLAYLPNLGQVRLRLTYFGVESDTQDDVQHRLDEKVQELIALLPDLVFGYERQTLEQVIGELLTARGQRLALAESCTGGRLSQRITQHAGVSAFYLGGITAYANDLKTRLLDVQPHTLAEHGAVSEAVAREMLAGALSRTGADYAIATTGIAGPSGGTPDKPVGTVWIAVGNSQQTKTYRLSLGKSRVQNIDYTANFALNMLRRFLLGVE